MNVYVYMIDDYADKTITKDTNVIDLNHRYNTQLISTREKRGMNVNHPSLNISNTAEDPNYQLCGEF